MPQSPKATPTLRLSALLGFAALLLASSAQAQVVRPSNTLYLALRGGATVYGGELDQTNTIGRLSGEGDRGDTAWLFADFGWLAGAELGYQFTPALGFGVGFNYANYANLDKPYVNQQSTGLGGVVNENGNLPQVTAAFRYTPFYASKLSPFVNLGGTATFGSGDERQVGYGPRLGAGLDFAITPRVALFLESNFDFIFPDNAVDGIDPGDPDNTGALAVVGAAGGDDTEFDVLGFYGAGLRFNFSTGVVKPQIESLQCPARLTTGQAGSFMAMTNTDATEPVTVTWMWDDGMADGRGMTTSHTFSAPGTYTVTATATNKGGSDSESCLVTVEEPQIAPVLSGCRATPATANAGQEITFNATVNADASAPVTISVDFGDGTRASSLPARHAYSTTGTFTATITATNAYGSNSCTVPVTVGDSFCANITELNPVYFGYNQSTLSADARARLDENIEILRRCPEICVNLYGYTDDREGDKTRLSQRRADAVRDYYIAQGIPADRLRATGRGQDPNANSKEDPGPGDSRARRVDSIPTRCTGF